MRLIRYFAQINKYSKHTSILKIKQYFKNLTEFSFVPVDNDAIAWEINNLDTKNAYHKMIFQSRD